MTSGISGKSAAVVLGVLLAWSTTACSEPVARPSDTVVPPSATASSLVKDDHLGLYCAVKFPETWRSALRAGVGSVRPGDRVGFAVTATGSDYFASAYSAAWSGVEEVDVSTGSVRHISQFTSPDDDQVAWGAWDGRWLVWAETYSHSNLAAWGMYAWDSAKGAILTLYSAAPGAESPTAPLATIPVVWKGMAAWESVTSSGAAEYLFDLNTDKGETLYQGAAGIPMFWGSDVVFAVKGVGATNHFVGYSLRTSKEVVLPTGLASARGITYDAATSKEVVWGGTGTYSSWIWRPGWSRPQEINAPHTYPGYEGYTEFYGVAGSDFVWMTQSSPRVADPVTRSIATFPTTGGSIIANGNAILDFYPPPGLTKGAAPLLINSVLDVAHLPQLPGCAS